MVLVKVSLAIGDDPRSESGRRRLQALIRPQIPARSSFGGDKGSEIEVGTFDVSSMRREVANLMHTTSAQQTASLETYNAKCALRGRMQHT